MNLILAGADSFFFECVPFFGQGYHLFRGLNNLLDADFRVFVSFYSSNGGKIWFPIPWRSRDSFSRKKNLRWFAANQKPKEQQKLGGGFKHFLFSTRNPGEMESNLTNVHIFQMGWRKTTNQKSLPSISSKPYEPQTSWPKLSWRCWRCWSPYHLWDERYISLHFT